MLLHREADVVLGERCPAFEHHRMHSREMQKV
jgi:hypothetical protein